MPAHPINLARKEETLREAERLRTELLTWLCERCKKDEKQQYRTQLKSIRTLIDGALTDLQPDLNALDSTKEPGLFYADCRLLDLRILWLRRIWYFFKEKFDQRDDTLMGPLLRAADEVVWSCYHQIFEANTSLKQGPAPLPFIEAQYSPEAFPVELVPASLKDSTIGAPFLRMYLNQLPMPVVRLPPICVVAPWWLVYVGHEIGHHIHYGLNLVGWFRETVEQRIAQLGGSQEDAERWGDWSQEIFADIFSVLIMGPWAVTAMVAFELSNPQAMLKRRSRYPSPVVRLKLLAATADRLGVDGSARLQAYALDLAALEQASSEVSSDAAWVAPIIEIALGPLPNLSKSLPGLLLFRAEEYLAGGPVAEWSTAFLEQKDHIFYNNLREARLMTSATLHAWSEIVLRPEQERTTLYTTLTKRAMDVIVKCREEGMRAAATVSEVELLGTDLARLLRQADPIQLEGEESE